MQLQVQLNVIKEKLDCYTCFNFLSCRPVILNWWVADLFSVSVPLPGQKEMLRKKSCAFILKGFFYAAVCHLFTLLNSIC